MPLQRPPQPSVSRSNPARVLRIYLLMLGLVCILIYEALDKRHWEWIAPGKKTTALPTASGTPIPLLPSNSLSEELRRKLNVVRDDSLQIRPVEQAIYWELLREGERQRWGEADSSLRPKYSEVLQQIPTLRGELVSVSGKLRRLVKYDAPPEGGGTGSLYEAWFFSEDSGNHPWVAQFPTAPAGISPGDELSLPISVTGVLFKLYQYESRAGLSSAPLLVTDQVRIIPPVSAPTESSRRSLVPLAVLLLGLMVAAKYLVGGNRKLIRRQVGRARELPDRIEIPTEAPLSVVRDFEGEDPSPPRNENTPPLDN